MVAARFLKCSWPFWDIMHSRIKGKPKETLKSESVRFLYVYLKKVVAIFSLMNIIPPGSTIPNSETFTKNKSFLHF